MPFWEKDNGKTAGHLFDFCERKRLEWDRETDARHGMAATALPPVAWKRSIPQEKRTSVIRKTAKQHNTHSRSRASCPAVDKPV